MYFCFICSDAEIPAFEKFKLLTKNKIWPIFKRTNHRPKLKINSKIIFYIAGNGVNSQHFIASAIIDRIEEQKNTDSDPNQEFKQILFNVKFSNLKKFNKYINIKDHIDQLTFIEKKRSIYGLYFQGGVCKINKQSYEYIINHS